ncbi:MAG: tetraacyldisaccharide 4'-kinase [Candidatus Omnitrophica bacterium]|nr:tetraacyldisaccharide 4'-kinase [Candidatus Omnitrophota bacterium]
MRNFIYSLMTDEIKGPVPDIFKFLLRLLSLAYGLGIFLREIFYKFGIFKVTRAPIKVISVGNLTLGGTGKTPFVTTLARILKDELNKNLSVLIRGYGWDEQAMLKRNLPDVPIFVGENRVRLARRTIRLYGSDTAVLDDAFQYWELARDINIVLIDSRCPFGNGYLFPRGILREPKEAISRADIVVFTKVNKKTSDIDIIKKELLAINDRLRFIEAVHQPKYLYDVKNRKRLDLSFLAAKRVILISSIGDPSYFNQTVKDLGADIIEHIIFEDHHNYKESDIDFIMRKCDERSFHLIVTTEKDEVKLHRMQFSFGDYTLATLPIEMEIIRGKEILVDRLHSLYNS